MRTEEVGYASIDPPTPGFVRAEEDFVEKAGLALPNAFTISLQSMHFVLHISGNLDGFVHYSHDNKLHYFDHPRFSNLAVCFW